MIIAAVGNSLWYRCHLTNTITVILSVSVIIPLPCALLLEYLCVCVCVCVCVCIQDLMAKVVGQWTQTAQVDCCHVTSANYEMPKQSDLLECVNMSSRTSHGLWKKYLLLPWKTIISPSYTLFEVQCSCHLGTTWHKLNLILMIWSWWGWHQFKSNIDLIAQWHWHRTFQVESKTSVVKKMLIHSKQWSSMINFVAYIDNS
jgi:hypothetical protein